MKILMTGATGLLGQEIGQKLVRRGHQLWVISRNQQKAQMELPFPCEIIEANLNSGVIQGLPEFDAVIHLLGEPVAQRWSKKIKQRIYDSRIQSTKNLRLSLKGSPHFVSASAIGIYPSDRNRVWQEEDSPGRDFLARVCRDWEAEAASTNTAIVRIGIVLARQGGALNKMLLPFRLGLGGVIASGEQWMSWVHIDDLSEIFVWLVENKKSGIYNGVAPNAETNRSFSNSLAGALGRSLGPPIPAWVLRALFGEMSEVVLASQQVVSEKLKRAGFQFKYETLDLALQNICQYWKRGEEVFSVQQYLPEKSTEVFSFFSSAHNLESITPPTLNFKIRNVSTANITKGTLIDYNLKIHGVPVVWRTEIEDWQPERLFVDKQLRGPYKFWHHTHTFEALGSGTLMSDEVRYIVPLGFFGWLLSSYLVRKEIEGIFSFRRQAIFKKFFKVKSGC